MSATINVFNSAFNNDYKTIIVEDNKTISSSIKLDFENCLISINGNKCDENYILKENDIVTIRQFPSNDGYDVASWIFAPVTSVIQGFSTGDWSGSNIVKKSLKSIFESESDSITTKDVGSTESIPTISGAKNQSGAGKVIPLVIGESMYTPIYAAQAYTDIDPNDGTDGENQYLHALFCLGYNNIDLRKVSLGIYPLSVDRQNGTSSKSLDCSNSEEKNTVHYKLSLYQQELELRQHGEEVNLFPQKVVQENFNTELIHPEGANALVVQPFSAKYPQKIQIEIQFQNLVKYDDNGDMTENSVEIGCAYSLDGGATYKPFNAFYAKKSDIKITDKGNNDFGNNKGQYKVTEFKGTKNKAMRFVAEKTFTYDEVFNTATITRLKNNAIEFKIFRVSEDKSESNSKLQYKVYFSSIRTWCYDYNATDNSAYDNTGTKSLVPQIPIIKKYKDITARLGFKIKAGDELSGQIDELNVVLCSRARYCTITKENGEKIYTWSAVDDTVPTNNPAALALMVLQHTMRGEYAYKDSQIDMDSFGRFYEWCNSVDNELINSDCHRYIANGVLSKELKTSELVNQILACGHGKLVLNGNKYGVWFDRPQSTPVMILNSQNVLEASNSKSFSEDIDGYSAKFIDCLNDYQEDTIVCVPKNTTKNDSEYRLENIEIPWITDAARVYRHCMYNIACRRLRAETWTRKLGVDGNLIEIGNLVVVQDDTIAVGIGEGAEIKSVSVSGSYIKSITVDYPFAVSDITKTYGVKIQHSDRIYGVKVVTYEVAKFSKIGEYSVLTFNGNGISLNEIIVPTIGDIVAFGIFNRITTDALCFGKKDNGDGTFTLTLVPYQKGIYDAESGTIPKFISNVTSPKENGSKLSEELPSPTYKDVKEIAGNLISNIGLDTTPPTAPVLTNVSADNDGNITLVWNGSTDNNSGVSEYCIYHKTDGRFVRIQTIPHDNNSQAQYTFTHNTSEKFTTHYYYVTAKDKMNNESEPSETLSIENPVKTKPYEPKALKAMAMRDYIRLEWTCEQSTNASLNPRLFKVEIKRNDTDEWESVGEYSSRETLYYFDRSKDGYSEADKISKYQFRVKSVSVYELESEYCPSESVNVDNYLGWKIGDIEISSYATEGTLFIKASVKGSSYGDKFLNVKYGDEIVAENSLAGRMFYVKLNGYQEVSDITSKDIYVECYSVADNVSKTLAGSNIDTSLYKTYKITKPSVTAYADKQGIHISWSDNTSDYYLKPAYKLTIDGKEVLSAADTLDYNWLFADNTYPTKAEVLAHKIILSVSTAADYVEISDIATDISVFKGWIPDVPDIKLSVSGRTVPVSWNIQSDNVYDFLGCELQVAKGYKVTAGKYSVITDESELEWFAPALGLNPYESLENYKKGDKDGYLSVKGSSVAFSVPLFGQDNDGAMNTMYVYRARAFTKGGKSEWSDAYFIEVKPVSAYDVVKAWNINDSGEKVKIDGALGAKQIFVEELAAISANLGYITDGALQGNQYNYWAVNDTVLSDGSVLYKGAFRVGGVDKYIKVIPQVKNGVVTDYDVELHVGDFSMTATGTLIEGGYFTVKDSTGNILFQLTPEKASVQVNEGTYNSARLVDIYATPFYGENSNVNGTAFSDSLLCPYRYDFYNAKLYLIDIIYNSSSSSTLEIYEVSGRETTRKRRLEAISAFCWIKDGYVYYFSTTTVLLTKKNCIKKTKISTGITTNYTNIDDAINLKTVFVLGDYMVLYDDSDSNNTKLYLYNLTSSTKSEGFNIGKQSIIGFTEENDYLYIAISLSLGTSILRISKTSFAWEVTTCLFALDFDKMKVENEGIIPSVLFVKNNVISIQGAVTYFVTDSSTAKQEALVLVENPDFEIATDLNNLSKISSITVYGNDLKEDSLNKIRVKSNTGDYLFNIDDYYLYSLKRNDAEEPVECYNAVWKGSISYEKIQVLKEGEVYNGNNGMIVIPQVCFEYKDEQENNNALLICGYDIRVDADARYFQWTSVVGMYKTEQYNKKSKAVYETGIGFTGIYFNSLNDTYRYVTDTGAYLEFDSNGRLVSTKGDTGATGPQGPQGQSAGFGDITASVDDNTGIPEVTVTTKGFDSKKYIDFAFKNLKGKQGEPGVSVVKVEQIETSTENGGTNKIRITLSNGSTSDFVIKNGNSSTIDADHFKGTLPVSKGGTGATDAASGFNTLADAVRNSATPDDTEKMLLKPSGTWYKTTCLDFWNYIKGKISSVLGLTADSYNGTAASTKAFFKRGQISNTDTFQSIMNNEGTWNIADLTSGWTGMLVTFHQPGSQSGLMFRIKGGSSDIRNIEVNYSIDSNRFASSWQPLIGRIPTSAPSSPQNGDIWIE